MNSCRGSVRRRDAGFAEKHDGDPDYGASAPGEYAIVSSTLERRSEGTPETTEELVMPDPPIKGASTLVPFQVLTRGKDVVVAARFKKDRMQGVAILRTVPAKNPARL